MTLHFHVLFQITLLHRGQHMIDDGEAEIEFLDHTCASCSTCPLPNKVAGWPRLILSGSGMDHGEVDGLGEADGFLQHRVGLPPGHPPIS